MSRLAENARAVRVKKGVRAKRKPLVILTLRSLRRNQQKSRTALIAITTFEYPNKCLLIPAVLVSLQKGYKRPKRYQPTQQPVKE